uniref:C2H2-type domain-containing protein n=1 Tax=Erpetoichthys calabaricus TaxID=27687 RepID=A0A8C4THH4_ERPCA
MCLDTITLQKTEPRPPTLTLLPRDTRRTSQPCPPTLTVLPRTPSLSKHGLLISPPPTAHQTHTVLALLFYNPAQRLSISLLFSGPLDDGHYEVLMPLNLNTHSPEQTHSTQDFQCTFCSKSFRVQRYLNAHLKKHNTKPMMQCEHCQQCFKTTRAFKKHLQTHSTICSTHTFVLQRYLNKHLKTHSTERIIQCEHCQQCFKTTHAFKKHLQTHSNYFQCQHCTKSFACRTIQGTYGCCHCKSTRP